MPEADQCSVSAPMRAVGTDNRGRQLYWAEPGRFADPGLYVWQDGKNVRLFDADLAPVAEAKDPAPEAVDPEQFYNDH